MINEPADWKPFYTMVATASVTALALIFVAYQLKSKLWMEQIRKRTTLSSALVELWVPLILALVALIPLNYAWRFGAVVSGPIGIIIMIYTWFVYYISAAKEDAPEPDPFDRWQHRLSVIPFFVYVGIIVTGGLAFSNDGIVLKIVNGGLCVWLIFSGLSEAWIHFQLEYSKYGKVAVAPSMEVTQTPQVITRWSLAVEKGSRRSVAIEKSIEDN